MQFDLILKLESNSIQSILLWVLNKIYWIVANNWRSEIWIGKDKKFSNWKTFRLVWWIKNGKNRS